ncbi:MAG: hypothetical protein ACLFPQ_00610 [Candidatus Woesearchaeota archaeon]
MSGFENAVRLLVDIGFYDVFLPFIFVFTVVFAILEKAKIFGKDAKRYNAMVAFVLGFITVSVLSLVDMINNLLSYTALFVVGGVFALIILGTFGIKADSGNSWIRTLSFVFAFVGVLIFVGSTTGFFEKINIPWAIIRAASGTVIIFSVFVIIIWWIVRDSDKKIRIRPPKSSSSSGSGSSQSGSPRPRTSITPDQVPER